MSTTTTFEKVQDKVETQLDKVEHDDEYGITVHELDSDITQKPSDDYLAQHGTTGATIKRYKTRIQAKPDGLYLQEVKDVQCSPVTGPYTEVKEEEKISMNDAVARIVHDLEAMDRRAQREAFYNPDKLEVA